MTSITVRHVYSNSTESSSIVAANPSISADYDKLIRAKYQIAVFHFKLADRKTRLYELAVLSFIIDSEPHYSYLLSSSQHENTNRLVELISLFASTL